jgi:hypothetical protein
MAYPLNGALLNTRNQLFCAHLAIPFAIFVGVGGFVLTGWLPPPSPGLSVQDTARIFTDNTAMRIGVSFMALGAPLFLGPAVAFACQLRRIEGKFAVLSNLQMLGGAVGVLAIQFPAYFWLVISYRPDIPADIVAIVNNLAFFLLLAAYSPAVVQNVAIGLCILGAEDGAPQVYPRWLGYANLWLAVTLLPGAVVPFFRTGPFTYGGIFGFWLVAVGFFVWVILMWWFTVTAIREQARERTPAVAVAGSE